MRRAPADPPLHVQIFGDDEEARVALAAETVPVLRERARGFGWALAGQRREDILAQMAAHYLDPEACARAAAALPPEGRALLAALSWIGHDGVRALAMAYDRLLAALPAGARDPALPAEGNAALAAARASGLVLGGGQPMASVFGVPWPLAVAVPPPGWTPRAQPPAGWRREAPGDAAAEVAAAALALEPLGRVALDPFGGLAVMWHGQWPVFAEETPLDPADSRRRTLRIPAAQARLAEPAQAEVARVIGDADPARGRFVVAMLLANGLLRTDGQGAAQVDGAALDAWLAKPAAQRLVDVVARWPSLPYALWDDFACLAPEGVHPRRALDRWLVSPGAYAGFQARLRTELLYGLTRLPRDEDAGEGGWVDGAALGRLVAAVRPRHGVPAFDIEGWCLADEDGSPLTPESLEGRRAVEALHARLLRGSMRWLGLVETAVDPADPSGAGWAVRLSPLGRALLAGASVPPPRAASARWDAAALAVDVPLGGEQDEALAAARRYGAYVGPRPGAADGTHRFQLGPESLARAFGQGEGPQEIAARFAAAGPTLPAPASDAVAAWWARWGSVNIYHDLAVIEVADAHVAAVVRAVTVLDQVLVYAAGPTTFVVPEDAVDGLLEALRRAGHTPGVTAGAGPADEAPEEADDRSDAVWEAEVAAAAKAAVARARRRSGRR